MNRRYYITGVGGMVGSHLVDILVERGIPPEQIAGTFYKPTTDIREIEGKAVLQELDVRYAGPMFDMIQSTRPQVIFHLAAQSYPTVSWMKPEETMAINVQGTVHLFEAIRNVRRQDPSYDPVVVVACSSAEYGASLTPENTPVRESAELLPLHPYGVSKVAQDLLAYQYHANDGIRTIRARIFNTTGPRKVGDVLSDFCRRAVAIERGSESTLRVGNLDTRRGITDVRDLVHALLLLADQGEWGECYNICGQYDYRIGDLIPMIEQVLGRSLQVWQDPALLRPSDEPVIFGDASRLIERTGWRQQITIEQTISDSIQYWRAKGSLHHP
ncbi:MAG TPA: GDP-mannose 4,6-dehydratase [Saprospiraceae bacterium]|nr:GDP-mannose 4,6-dehydratase [Saprospiraceae bacterium]HRW76191.1 GDP-mannose 4,6-dehydratase [Saprospiraceae bacterium]